MIPKDLPTVDKARFYIIDTDGHICIAVLYRDTEKVFAALMYQTQGTKEVNCRISQITPVQLASLMEVKNVHITVDYQKVLTYLEDNRVIPPTPRKTTEEWLKEYGINPN